jgi:hypothetical protein
MITFEILFRGVTINVDAIGIPAKTQTGVRCGNCGARHASAKAVNLCYLRGAELDAESAAEIAAEAAYERHLEDRGYWEARAQEDHENRYGVIQFDEAYRMACPWLFEDDPIDA